MGLLNIKDVSIKFGGLKALDTVSLKPLGKGEIRSLIGPNGAGKSTLINVITGLYRPNSGSIKLNGQELLGLPPYRRTAHGIARTFQTTQIFGDMTVLENIMVGRHSRTKSELLASAFKSKSAKKEYYHIMEKSLAILDFLGLSDSKNQVAGTLPYGSQRIIELGRALASEPVVLLLDEPSCGMNPQESYLLMNLLKKIRSTGITILLIEHDMSLVMGISDYISVLNFGKIIAEGKPAEIQKNEQVIEAYLGGGFKVAKTS